MAGEPWRGAVNGVLYGAQHAEVLDDSLAAATARDLVAEPVQDRTQEDQYTALAQALRTDAELTEMFPDARHSESAFRDFLRRLLDQMDALRPWPEPPFRGLSITRWHDLARAEPIARVAMRPVTLQERLRTVFRPVALGDHKVEATILRLRSGDEVALAGPWWPDSQDVALLAYGARPPEPVVAAFVDATGLPGGVVTPTHSTR